jgi:hypothetical protein
MRLPFPIIFFEFAKPLEVNLLSGKKNLRGMLYGKEQAFIARKQPDAPVQDNPNLHIDLHFDITGKSALARYSMLFNPRKLPDFYYSVLPLDPADQEEFGFYQYSRESGLKKIAMGFKGMEGEKSVIRSDMVTVPETEDTREFPKLIDLAINLVSYVNAQNVEVVKSSRGGNDKELDKVNRKRAAKGKNPIKPPKPYYWVNIKKSYVSEDDEHEEGEKLKWRVWVRGHNRHYQHMVDPIWIEPHVKGPRNAPWRHDRYAVLYKNFRYLLPRRGDESL